MGIVPVRWGEQRGSITAIWVAVIAAFFLIGLIVLEREWANYQIRLLEQAADLAAEAGAYHHETQATVSATLTKIIKTEVCGWEVPPPIPGLPPPTQPVKPIYTCHEETTIITEPRSAQGRFNEVEGTNWKLLLDCDVDGWTCSEPKIDEVCITPGTALEQTARETLIGNWRPGRAVRLLDSYTTTTLVPASSPAGCSPTGVGLSVHFRVDYTLRPFFGIIPLEQTRSQHGTAVVKVKIPSLSL